VSDTNEARLTNDLENNEIRQSHILPAKQILDYDQLNILIKCGHGQ
jgi:hypothetical protein